jgi:hypothetical protein
MTNRYSVGFKDPEIKCGVTEDYPLLVPIVDYRMFGFGEVIGFALGEYEATTLVEKLQALEDLKDKGFKIEQ